MNFSVELTATGYTIPADSIGGDIGPESAGVPAIGFVVVCFVVAKDEDEACTLAYETLMADDTYRQSVAPCADPEESRIEVTYWAELSSFDGCPVPMSPFIFFSSESEEDDGGNSALH